MGLFRDKTHYDRTGSMDAASKAQGKGNRKKAIAEYRKVLSHEPENFAVHGKVAVLLAESKQLDEAWDAFVAAAEGFKKQGFEEKALALYQQATRYLPREVELWETISAMHVAKGRSADGVKVLLDGRKAFSTRKLRPMAIRLLEKVRKLDPWHFDATMDLAKLLAKDGEKAGARRLLEGLASRVSKKRIRRVRAALFKLSPTPAAAWRWMRGR